MNQIFLVSTFFGGMNVAAAIEEGHFGDRGEHRRTLLVSTNSVIPEVTTPVHELPGAAPLTARFDDVVDWNRAVAPFHPSQFTEVGDTVVTGRWLRSHLQLTEDPIELVLESIQVPPAQTLAALFPEAAITIYSDGLMSYGPTRVRLPRRDGLRVSRLVHLDLVPGLTPVLLSEFGVPTVRVGDEVFRRVVDEVAAACPADPGVDRLPIKGRRALVLGQYLAALDLLSDDEESELYASTTAELSRASYDTVVFKPHPTAPPSSRQTMTKVAADHGVDLHVLGSTLPLEVVLTRWRPDLVTGCFSTGLLVAQRFFDLPVTASGTSAMLTRLRPFENSNRIPIVIVDATIPALDAQYPGGIGPARYPRGPADPDLTDLVSAVAFLMQPKLHGSRRDQVQAVVAELDKATVGRYLASDRLARLGLPGVAPSVRWRTKRTLASGYVRCAAFGRRHPWLARRYRSVRRVIGPTVDQGLRRLPRVRRAVRAIVEEAG